MDGQDIQEVKEGEADLLCPAVAQDGHQAAQTTLWSEQIPNAVDYLRQRSADRLRRGTSGSSLNGLHPEARGETG